jgi:hypothetical protein
MIDLQLAASCSCSFRARCPEHHDRLLQLEDDGIYGATELLELALTWDELDYSGRPVIGPEDWLGFVAAHRWHDPTAVEELVTIALDCLRRGRRGARPRLQGLTG